MELYEAKWSSMEAKWSSMEAKNIYLGFHVVTVNER